MRFLALIITSILLSTNALSLKITNTEKSKNGQVTISLKLRTINDQTIIDPSKEFMTMTWGKRTLKFSTAKTFLKSDRYNKKIFAKDGKHFISIDLQKRSPRVYKSTISYRNLNNKKLLQYTGLVKIKTSSKKEHRLLGYLK